VNQDVVLLVEDDPQDEALTTRALRANGVDAKIVVARDGAEALDLLLGPGGGSATAVERPPVVVLLDLNLPKIGGLEVLRRIRAEARVARTPVVILTSSDEERDVASGYDLGANGYVCKPVDFDAFADAIGRLGRFWCGANTPPPPRESPAAAGG
jgi:two-component system, response regulator